MKLIPSTMEELQMVRKWRNDNMSSLRTSYMLNEKQQEMFYESISSPQSNHRYYGLWQEGAFVGLGGITYIQWENRLGEISLIIGPDFQKRGYGTIAVDEILRHAFLELNLKTIIGECYLCNPAITFWKKIAVKYGAFMDLLPNRKFWNGKYHKSFYFSIDSGDYEKFIQQTGNTLPAGI